MSAPSTTVDLKQAKEEAVKLLLRPNSNVVGVGIGKKVKDGKETPEDCVRVYVVSKSCPNDLSPNSLVPPTFLDVPSDVIEVGRFGRKGKQSKMPAYTTPQPGSPIRVNTNSPNVNAGVIGTLGAVVTDGKNRYILSCNHILRRNGRVLEKEATVVSAVFVGEQEEIATPGQFIDLDHYGGNSVDCALALLQNAEKVQATFPDDLKLSSSAPITPTPGKVTKLGAVTGRTYGTIVDIDADLYIDYSFGTFLLEHQVMIDGGSDTDLFAAAGDSGSIVVDQGKGQATAIIFAASGRFAVACPLETALQQLTEKAGVSKLEVVT